jgi:hypothetical protein
MRKYAPLRQHLERRNGRPELLTFEDIEAILGAGLPPSALRHRSFWANDNEGHHSHASAWRDAGYRVAWIDRNERVVRFERTR